MRKEGEPPRYVRLHRSGELKARVDTALAGLARCGACPWNCGIDRMAGETKVCHTGRFSRVSSYFPHHGEEGCLKGWNGSGTIFFSRCNLHCVFCQNYDISQNDAGCETPPEKLALMMLELELLGCHNINLVTPEHVVPQILEALYIAIGDGLRLPIVYNTSGFDSLESLRLMDGIVDIYMPDFKVWTGSAAKRYLKCPDYPETAKETIREMHRQVGDLTLDEEGLAAKGLLVRHLIMPGMGQETREILAFLAQEISRDTYMNLMDQYRPVGIVSPNRYPEIDRPITRAELEDAYDWAREVGLNRFDCREP